MQAAGTERLFTLRSAMAIATGEAEEAEREAEVVEPQSSKGSHSRKDGNPLGWLALERGFYLHGTNSVLEGLRHCCPPDHISHIT